MKENQGADRILSAHQRYPSFRPGDDNEVEREKNRGIEQIAEGSCAPGRDHLRAGVGLTADYNGIVTSLRRRNTWKKFSAHSILGKASLSLLSCSDGLSYETIVGGPEGLNGYPIAGFQLICGDVAS